MKTKLAAVLTALALAGTILGSAATASADSVGYVCTALPPAGAAVKMTELRDDRGACRGFEVRDSKGKTVQVVRQASLGSGMLLSSRDGRTVLFVQTFPLGRVDAHGHIRDYDRKPYDGVVIFRDGAEVARIGLDRLVATDDGLKQTVSHVIWDDGFDQEVGARWKVKTLAGVTYAIDTATGALSVVKP